MKTKTIFKHAILASSLILSNSSFAVDFTKLANNVTMPSGVVKVGSTKFVTDHIHGICAIDEANQSYFKLDDNGDQISSATQTPATNPLTGEPLMECIKPTDLVAPGKPVTVTIGGDTYLFLVDLASPSAGGLWRLKYNTTTGWDTSTFGPITSFINPTTGKSLRPTSLAINQNGSLYDLYIGTNQETVIYKIANVINNSVSTAFATTLSNLKGPLALEVLGTNLFILEDGRLTKVDLAAQPTQTVTTTRIRGRVVTTRGPLIPPKATSVNVTNATPVGMTQLAGKLYYATFNGIYQIAAGQNVPVCSNLPTAVNKCFYDTFTPTDVAIYNPIANTRPELGLTPITADSPISLTITSLDMIDGKLIIGDDDLIGAFGGEGMGHVWSITIPQ